MSNIEQTLDSREVAEMIEKEHSKLLRDLRRYEEQFIEAKIGFNDFFRNSEYKDSIGRTLPCYRITKKGCEFIAHKLTGIKGTLFTARYINRFHEMQNALVPKAAESELPWFIRKFRGYYIVLFRDFVSVTGIDPVARGYTAWERPDKLVLGYHWNGWGWKCDNEEFIKEYGFEYGNDPCMIYFHIHGVYKVLHMIEHDKNTAPKPGSCKIIKNGLDALKRTPSKPAHARTATPPETITVNHTGKNVPIRINIICENPATSSSLSL